MRSNDESAMQVALGQSDLLLSIVAFLPFQDVIRCRETSKGFCQALGDPAFLEALKARFPMVMGRTSVQLRELVLDPILSGAVPWMKLVQHVPHRWPTGIRPLYWSKLQITDLGGGSNQEATSNITRIQYYGGREGDRVVLANAPFPRVYRRGGLSRSSHSALPFVWAQQPLVDKNTKTSSGRSTRTKTSGASGGAGAALPFVFGASMLAYYEITISEPPKAEKGKAGAAAPPAPAGTGSGLRGFREAEHDSDDDDEVDVQSMTTPEISNDSGSEFGRPSCVAVGLAAKPFPVSGKQPGWDANSYGWHGDDGRVFHGTGIGRPFGPAFEVGDTVGCGICYFGGVPEAPTVPRERPHAAPPAPAQAGGAAASPGLTFGRRPITTSRDAPHSQQALIAAWDLGRPSVFFTLNGVLMGCAFNGVDVGRGWYPCVGVDSADAISFNFGAQPFAFDVAGLSKQLWRHAQQGIYPGIGLRGANGDAVEAELVAAGFRPVDMAPPPPPSSSPAAASAGSDAGPSGSGAASSSAPSSAPSLRVVQPPLDAEAVRVRAVIAEAIGRATLQRRHVRNEQHIMRLLYAQRSDAPAASAAEEAAPRPNEGRRPPRSRDSFHDEVGPAGASSRPRAGAGSDAAAGSGDADTLGEPSAKRSRTDALLPAPGAAAGGSRAPPGAASSAAADAADSHSVDSGSSGGSWKLRDTRRRNRLPFMMFRNLLQHELAIGGAGDEPAGGLALDAGIGGHDDETDSDGDDDDVDMDGWDGGDDDDEEEDEDDDDDDDFIDEDDDCENEADVLPLPALNADERDMLRRAILRAAAQGAGSPADSAVADALAAVHDMDGAARRDDASIGIREFAAALGGFALHGQGATGDAAAAAAASVFSATNASNSSSTAVSLAPPPPMSSSSASGGDVGLTSLGRDSVTPPPPGAGFARSQSRLAAAAAAGGAQQRSPGVMGGAVLARSSSHSSGSGEAGDDDDVHSVVSSGRKA